MIKTEGLSKVFEDKKRGRVMAADSISFEVREGEIFGLLGTNGAGKTTTLRMIATILKPTSGKATVAGYDVVEQPGQVRQQIGFLSGDTNLYTRLSGREVIRYYGGLAGMQGDELSARIDELVARFEMGSFVDSKVGKLSTGQRQRVSICRAIVHQPPLMIFDEPTSGLDPVQARHILDFIRDARRADGKTLIFSTHYLREAETLCDRIAIIHNGQLQAIGTLEEIFAQTGTDDLEQAFFRLTIDKKTASAVV
jgi:sodium transport system ATP-binding protein